MCKGTELVWGMQGLFGGYLKPFVWSCSSGRCLSARSQHLQPRNVPSSSSPVSEQLRAPFSPRFSLVFQSSPSHTTRACYLLLLQTKQSLLRPSLALTFFFLLFTSLLLPRHITQPRATISLHPYLHCSEQNLGPTPPHEVHHNTGKASGGRQRAPSAKPNIVGRGMSSCGSSA